MVEAPLPTETPKAPDICVIANAKAGKQDSDLDLEAMLAAHPNRFVLRRVSSGTDLEGAAAGACAEGFETVAAAGGDGTINAVANAVAETEARLGAVPMGTFNYFARNLGIPEDAEAAIAVLAGQDVMAVDVGMINNRVFINNASLGLYPAVLQQRERTYKKWGRSRFMALFSVLKTLWRFRGSVRMKITVDGAEWRLRTPSVFIACNPYQLRSVKLEGADKIEAGRLALIAAPDSGRFRLMLNFLTLGLGFAQKGREFELISGEEIVVETNRRNKVVAIDGERLRMRGPFRFSMRKAGLQVVAPAAQT